MELPFDIRGIMEYLPHRYPFLLVDRIVDLVPGESVRGLKNVTINEPFFNGHFPAEPIMPGVLILEAMAQAGGILAFASNPDREPGSIIYFSGMDEVRFRRPVVPGDQLLLDLVLKQQRKRAMRMEGRATVDGVLTAQAQLMAVWR
ncbi:MAG: 3-hydroxyacyl-ACP dehydratase FabZ [Deltaproteobacteria bacterium]|nr:3-hydroxyacyl-ACP dehydratase FabZ [Deltaproteobacteria bacterium]